MKSLDEYLEKEVWKPSLDMLERLGKSNSYCRKLSYDVLNLMPFVPGLAVFIIREKASSEEDENKIAGFIKEEGFSIIKIKRLNSEKINVAARYLRGGNWGKASSVHDGGGPVIAIVTRDPNPINPDEKLLKKIPYLDNERIITTKHKIREFYFEQILHSTDSSRQAVHYLELLMPEVLEELSNNIIE